MGTPSKVSQSTKREYVEKMRLRYQRRGREARSLLLDELVDFCGYDRKYAIKLMNKPIPADASAGVRHKETRGRKPIYGESERKVLKVIWLAADQPCGKLCKPMMRYWLPHYERENGRLTRSLRKRLITMSGSTIDRLLRPVKATETRRRNSGTKPGTLIKSEIPIRTDNDDIDRPGYVEADTVAHCGGRLEGDFVWTVDLTDIDSQWTECRAVWNKGQHGVVTAIAEIEEHLPFDLIGFDSDNGSEFLNWHLVKYLQDRGEEPKVAFTRSRPYRKNDNARVEQKNWTHARQLLGYDRFANVDSVEPLNEAYRSWCMLKNFFVPVMKLTVKTRVGGKYRKRYDEPQTPAERLLDWEGLSKESKRWLKEQQRELNPFELKRQVESALKRAFEQSSMNEEKLEEWQDDQAPENRLPQPSASLIG